MTSFTAEECVSLGEGTLPGIEFAWGTDSGRVRKNNEDSLGGPWFIKPDRRGMLSARGALFAVADGMGGHARGEVASRVAIEALFRSYYGGSGDPALDLRQAVLAANREVVKAGRPEDVPPDTSPERGPTRMGTTLVAVVVRGAELYVANVGDSRAYRFRDGKLAALTRDDSLVAEEVRRGVLSPEEAANFPYRNILTHALGSSLELDVAVDADSFRHGDAVLLCSDGLHGPVADDEVARVLSRADARGAAKELVEMANAAGGPDNVTVVVVTARS